MSTTTSWVRERSHLLDQEQKIRLALTFFLGLYLALRPEPLTHAPSAAGGTGNGTIAQAKEYRLRGQNVWAVGVDSDQYEDGLYADKMSAVLTSMIKRVESSTEYALRAVKDGKFEGKVITFDTASDGVGFSVTNPALTPDIVAKVNQVRQDIIDKKITVIPTYAEALAKGVVPANLQASDR